LWFDDQAKAYIYLSRERRLTLKKRRKVDLTQAFLQAGETLSEM